MTRRTEKDRLGLRKIITRGIRRRLFRNIATMACFAFVAGTLLLTGILVAGAQSGVQAGVDRLGPDMVVVPLDPDETSNGVFLTGKPTSQFFDRSVEDGVAQTPGVAKVSSQAFLGSIDNVSWCPSQVQVIGYEPSSDFTIGPLISSSYGRPIENYEIVVGSSIVGDLGSTIVLYGEAFTVAGRLESTGVSIDQSVFVTLDKAYLLSSSYSPVYEDMQLKPGEISAVLVKIDSSEGIDPVMYWITAMNPGVLVFPMSELGRELVDQLSITSQGLYMTVSMVVLVSLPLIVLISSMTVNERQREIGLMRAMGATKEFIFSIFFVEGIYLALLGASIGVLGSTLVLVIFEGWLTSVFQTSIIWPSLTAILIQITLAMLATMALAGTAALWPAFRASRMEPYEAIRSGQN
ncbi:MAG: FtsX-like permease family protein [Methanomassiliicoccales archaeon]|jgi:putative ABC transport system permease protein